MANRIVAGLAAGACGTLALNTVGYVDMLVRGRAASRLPAEVAGKIAEEIGLPLDFDLEADADSNDADSDDDDSEEVSGRLAIRQEALGALLGYTSGLQLGLLYGLVRLILPRPPTWLAGAALGSVAMAASNYPAARLGLTDPQTWDSAHWMADALPHMAFGFVAVATFEAIKK